MKVTKAFVGPAAVAAALTLTPMTGAQAAGAACSPGGELTHMFKAAACPRPFVDKGEYAPGETIRINLVREKECTSFEATSEGFTAAAKLTQAPGGEGYVLTGEAEAGNTPGVFTARVRCDQAEVSTLFTIKAPTPPTTTKPPAPGKPKPPITKPKGAADTGGGGTA